MTTSLINAAFVFGLLAFFALPVAAQTPADQTPAPATGRDASFLTSPSPPPPVAGEKPTVLATPVERNHLQAIDSETIGLLAPEGGGLGAAMWKGVPHELVDRLLPSLTLPTASPALNGLAQRFLLTIANMPEGAAADGMTLIAMRVEKLVMLGDAADAWNLALLAKAGQVDETTLRLAAEAALASPAAKDVCEKLPAIVQNDAAPEWQKSLVTCQLRAGDTAAAQLGLEILHTQNVRDDTFFELAERNIIAGVKSLPRQLTPLKPLDLALLRLIDQPLPPEIYAHPDTAAIPELLKAKARDDTARLALAERAAARGIISSGELAAVYRSLVFSPDDLADPRGSKEVGARRRAELYQAALQEKTPQKRLEETAAFMEGLDAPALNGAAAALMAEMIGNIHPSGDYSAYAVMAMRVFIMAGKPDEALGWLKAARQAIAAAPAIGVQLQEVWPLIVLSGIESGDYGPAFASWLDAALKGADRVRRAQIGNLLLLFDAAGFAVPESAWAHVIDQPDGTRRLIPPSALLLDRLRAAGAAGRRGEAVLLALALTGAGLETPPLPTIETIRALRLVGLTADALAFARETVSGLLAPATELP